MNRFRVGIVGYGYTGRLHHIAYDRAGAEVNGVADPNPRQEIPSNVRRYASARDLFAADIDIVSLCVPNALHCELTLEALAAGKHVLLEKPIAINLDEARRMMEAAAVYGRTLFVGMTHRFYPEVRAAKAAVDAGEIGRVVAITDCIYEHFGFLDSPRWYLDRQMAGGGTVLSSGIHLVDRVLWFAGDRVTEVWGNAGNPFFGEAVEDCANMSLRFASGCSAQIAFALLREPAPLTCRLTVLGTAGMVVVDTWKGYEIHAGKRKEVRDIYGNTPHSEKVLAGMRAEIQEFFESIQERREPCPPATESTRALAIVCEFYEAAKTRLAQSVNI